MPPSFHHRLHPPSPSLFLRQPPRWPTYPSPRQFSPAPCPGEGESRTALGSTFSSLGANGCKVFRRFRISFSTNFLAMAAIPPTIYADESNSEEPLEYVCIYCLKNFEI